MTIFESLKKATQTLIEDLNTPESFKKGKKFEEFTRDVIFTSDRYKLLKLTHDYDQNHADYVESSLEPDFEFECLKTKKKFYVEAKYRSWFYKDKLNLFSKSQFQRLKKINKNVPVFIIIGLDEDPDDPAYICLVPISDIKSTFITDEIFEDYVIAPDVCISPKKLWALLNTTEAVTKNINKTKSKSNKNIKSNGYCIRCKDNLKIDIKHPFCKSCYQKWNKFKNPDYLEKFCHICGKSQKVTFEKPACYNCYKNL